jgi:hypothetical protein
LPEYIGPVLVESLSDTVVQVKLPESCKHVHDKFNIIDVRQWLSSDRSPDVVYHPALNPFVQLLDRKTFGRAPKRIGPYLAIPCQYYAVRKKGEHEWIKCAALTEPSEVQLIKQFEKNSLGLQVCLVNPSRLMEPKSSPKWKKKIEIMS